MSSGSGLGWSALPRAAQIYAATIIAAGLTALVWYAPRQFPQPAMFAAAIAAACITSAWKVNLPTSLASGSTLSVSYAADLLALLLLGPRHALVVSIAGVWTQCTVNVKQKYPLYRTLFSISAEAITIVITGMAYTALGGTNRPFDFAAMPRAIVGAIGAYFFINTGLVAGAIALSRRESFRHVWREDFLWSVPSYIVAGSAGAAAAIVIDRGEHWKAMLMLAPIYLTYRTYQVFTGRLEDQKRHVKEMQEALAEKTRLEQVRNDLFEREQAARASAEQANKLKDQFLAIVSHELRTPLNAILGWSDMLRNGTLEGDRRTRAVHAIHDSARRQAALIEELLDVARIMSGKLRLERSPLDLREIVRSAVETVQPVADAKRIAIDVHVDPSVDVFHGDGSRLRQVIWNLLTNAIKFTPEGGTLWVTLHNVDEGIELTVRDSGPGIPVELLSTVFEPFRQVDGSTTRRHGGLGLGLSIVRQLVHAHGGTITAASQGEGHGSTFTVWLPAASSAAVAGPFAPAIANTQPSAVSLAGISVLVVDDDDQSREVVAAYLQAHQASVVTAESAVTAFRMLKQQAVDVLLADIAMPGEDGYSLIRRIRALKGSPVASIPAAALTAFTRDEDRQRALEAGFQMHLSKPVDARQLIDAVATLAPAKLAIAQ